MAHLCSETGRAPDNLPAPRCRSAALCRRKSCLTSLSQAVVGHTVCEKSHHTHSSCLHSQLTWSAEIVQVGRSAAAAAAAARWCRSVRWCRRDKRRIGGLKKTPLCGLPVCRLRVNSSALHIFKLCPARVASFCASVPPCCSLRRSATSDVDCCCCCMAHVQQPVKDD